MRIQNWSIVSVDANPYAAPETLRLSLSGNVFGHPRFIDGHCITTSSIVGKNTSDEILTHSGSSYQLGMVDPDYEKKFPDAKNELLNNLSVT